MDGTQLLPNNGEEGPCEQVAWKYGHGDLKVEKMVFSVEVKSSDIIINKLHYNEA